tara:strand:+ start:8326 stop:8994 length:669 start_codon:yes stop_codon:yes gene_type:complete
MDSYKAIIQLIKSSRITQSELARKSGLTPTAINRWLNRRVTSIRPSNVEAIANALGKEIIWINNSRSDCEIVDINNNSLSINFPEKQHSSRIEWHMGFPGWLQIKYLFDYEEDPINYTITKAYDGTMYSWKETIGYSCQEIIGINYIDFIHDIEREHIISRSRELGTFFRRTNSPILENDLIYRFKHLNGKYKALFLHSRVNLKSKRGKSWCLPLPRTPMII